MLQAMWVASNNGHTQLVKLLAMHGAKFDEQRLDSGETPLNAGAVRLVPLVCVRGERCGPGQVCAWWVRHAAPMLAAHVALLCRPRSYCRTAC